jgi:16S rRNA (guanine527-N7)-methyltransferase
MIEAEQRKATFLATMIRQLDLPARVSRIRIEAMPRRQAPLLSARALAPLAELIAYAADHRRPAGKAFFPKGRRYQKELDDALRRWEFEYRLHQSRSDPDAVIVEIGAIHGAE